MVEISLSGSGEGPGWVTAPGYSTAPFSAPPILGVLTTKPRRGYPAPSGGNRRGRTVDDEWRRRGWLRRQSVSGTSGSAVGANESAYLGAVRGSTSRLPAPRASDLGSNLGFVTTSRISGGAGWWQSPCPDLERARGG